MDPRDVLFIRFHFEGQFLNDGKSIEYIGGKEAMSFVYRKNFCFFDLVQSFGVHCQTKDDKMFHWLYPGKEMVCGLKMVALDTDCKQIRDCVAVGSIAEIYVELYPNSENDENDKDPGRDVELLMGPNASSESEEVADHFVALATCPPTDNDCVAISNSEEHEEENSDAANDSSEAANDSSEAANENSEAANENSEEDEDEDSSESDYCPDDDIISDEDEEAVEINKKYKEYKAKMKAGQLEHLDDAMLDGGPAIGSSNKVGEENDGNGTAYEDSSDLYDSFDEIGSDGEMLLQVQMDQLQLDKIQLQLQMLDHLPSPEAMQQPPRCLLPRQM